MISMIALTLITSNETAAHVGDVDGLVSKSKHRRYHTAPQQEINHARQPIAYQN
jgi:hypothetical protein